MLSCALSSITFGKHTYTSGMSRRHSLYDTAWWYRVAAVTQVWDYRRRDPSCQSGSESSKPANRSTNLHSRYPARAYRFPRSPSICDSADTRPERRGSVELLREPCDWSHHQCAGSQRVSQCKAVRDLAEASRRRLQVSANAREPHRGVRRTDEHRG